MVEQAAALASALYSSYSVLSPNDLAELENQTVEAFIHVQLFKDTDDVHRKKFREAVQAARASKAKVRLLRQCLT